MSVGHGTLGLLSGRRSFSELTEQSFCGRVAYLDLPVGRAINAPWSLTASATYTATQLEEHDGVALEPIAIETLEGDHLTRVETVALCQAGAGTFYAVPAQGILYVHLSDGSDPNGTTVVVSYLRRFGARGTFDPVFGPERLTNSGFETYTAGSGGESVEFTGWAAENAAAMVLGLSPYPFKGAVSARVRVVNLAASAVCGITQGVTLQAGGHYIVSGAYRTDPHLDADLSATIRITLSAGVWLDVLGRNETLVAADGLHALAATGGEWRRFVFAIRPQADVSGLTGGLGFLVLNSGGGAATSGWIEFDEVRLRRVYRYEYAEPRLSLSGLPAVEIGSRDVFFGAEEVGLGVVRLLNSDDGYLEALLGDFDVIGRKAQLYLSGAFDDGQEVMADDWWPGFGGIVQKTEVSDQAATLDLQDLRSLLSTKIPVRHADRSTFADISDRDEGRPRALLFGSKSGIIPIRLALDATTRLPTYEVVDTTDAVGASPMAIDAVYVYLDEESANRHDITRRLALTGSQYAATAATGRLALTQNPGPFVVLGAPATLAMESALVGMNDALDIDVGGTPGTAYLTPGIYSADTLATEVAARLNALGLAAFTVTYSTTTHDFTITKGGFGAYSLLLASGTNKERSAFAMLGFTGASDKTGGPSYSSDVAVYGEDRADSIVIRIDAKGHTDDASGTYTGTAGARIERPADVLHFLLRRVLKRPATEIDTASFVAARTASAQILGIYLGGTAAVLGGEGFSLTLQEIVDRLEAGSHADAVMDGSGVWFWSPRGTSSQAIADEALGAPVLYDRDFLDFTCSKSAEVVYEIARVLYDQDPSTAFVRSVEVAAAFVRVRHGRSGAREDGGFPTFLLSYDDAVAQAWNLLLLGALPRRHLRFRVKGRLMQLLPGSLIRVQRTRMMGSELAAMLNSDVFRLLRLRIDPLTHEVEAEAYTADMPRAAEFISGIVGRLLRPTRLAPPATAQLAVLPRSIRSGRPGLK